MDIELPAATANESQQQKFALPVDSENKATVFRLFSLANPHMRAFHLPMLNTTFSTNQNTSQEMSSAAKKNL